MARATPASPWQRCSTQSGASWARFAAGQTGVHETARADGPRGHVYGEPWGSGASPAARARRSRVIKRQTGRADGVYPRARSSRQSCLRFAPHARQRRIREGLDGVNAGVAHRP